MSSIGLVISFDQLIDVVKTLSATQLKLKVAIENEERIELFEVNLEKLLLEGPIASKEELKTIQHNRKAINQWRQAL